MKTQTYPPLVKTLVKMGFGGMATQTHHEKTETNTLGQSGIDTFIDDVIDIVLNSKNEKEAYRNLWDYLKEGEIKI